MNSHNYDAAMREYNQWIGRDRKFHIADEDFAGKDVVELGSGWGCNLFSIVATAKSVVGVDIEPEYAEFSKEFARQENIEPPRIIIGPAESVPLKSHSFDCVLLWSSLPYMDIDRALNETSRLLRKGGTALVTYAFMSQYLRSRKINWHYCVTTANSLSYEVRGRRLSTVPGTSRPVHISERKIMSLIKKSGLECFSVLRMPRKSILRLRPIKAVDCHRS